MSECSFYNKSFIDDLYPFTVQQSESDPTLKTIIYNIEGGNKKVQLLTNLEDLDFNPPKDSIGWCPIFIDMDTVKTKKTIKNKYLLSSSSVLSENLGIEDVLSFEPQFQSWDCTSGSMSVDWILTPPVSPYIPEYGLLCWSKKAFFYSDKDTADKQLLSIDQIPYNTIIYPEKSWSYTIDDVTISINEKTRLIKKSNNILFILDNDIFKTNGDDFLPNSTPRYFLLSNLLSSNNKNIQDEKSKLKLDQILFKLQQNQDYHIHISDGEAYSYFDSDNDKISALKKDGLPSKTYLSRNLYDIYRHIYHHLTIRYEKKINIYKIPEPLFNRKQGRLFKKLCYFLSTHPQIDRTTVSILQNKEIFDMIDKYINSYTSYKDELSELKKILTGIGSYFNNLISNNSEYDNPNYLINKLISKYGAKLRIKNKGSLTYNKPLSDGPHIKVSSDIGSLCDVNLKNTLIYNNVTIDVSPFTVKSVLNESESSLTIGSSLSSESISIPLWDILKKDLIKQETPFTVGADIEIDWNNRQPSDDYDIVSGSDTTELAIQLKGGLLISDIRESALAGTTVSYTWSKIFGSECLKFSNAFLTQTRNNGLYTGDIGKLRFEQSNDEIPTIYIGKPGKYVIECQVSTTYGIRKDTVNIHITSNNESNGIYSRPISDPLRPRRIINLLSDDNNAVMLPNMKEFVFGKQGIFWPVYSDLNIMEPIYNNRFKVGNKVSPLGSLTNKFLIPYDRKEVDEKLFNESKLKFTFDCNNTIIELSKMSLSHICDSNHPNCEPIYRETFNNRLIDLDLYEKEISYPGTNETFFIKKPQTIGTNSFDLISSSGELLANILSNDKDNRPESLKFKNYNYNENIYTDEPAVKLACYESSLQESPTHIALQQSKNIKMIKGYFHPFSGWINSDTTTYENNTLNNRTCIMTGDGSKRHCKTFKGLGFEEISNDFADGKVKIYSSTISLNMSAPYDCTMQTCSGLNETIYNDLIETSDHYPSHGYRDRSGLIKSLYRYNDEFGVSPIIIPEGPYFTTNYCDDIVSKNNKETEPAPELLSIYNFKQKKTVEEYIAPLDNSSDQDFRSFISSMFSNGSQAKIAYSYPKPGPAYYSDLSVEQRRGNKFDRSFGRKIGDLEVKLNFLNYINPKELVIWLEVDPCEEIKFKITGQTNAPKNIDPSNKKAADLWFSQYTGTRSKAIENINNIINEDIKNYLLSLFVMNDHVYDWNIPDHTTDNQEETQKIVRPLETLIDTKKLNTTYYLYLTNQDHIDMSTYNNIIKFTDHVKNTFNNINHYEYITNKFTHSRLKNNILELQPTKSANGYSDIDIYKYNNIIDQNNLASKLGANFLKLNDLSLFAEYIDPELADGGNYGSNRSSTSFTLKIAVLGESDEGYSYDRLVNSDNIVLNSVYNKNMSSLSHNSLCSWELNLMHSKEELNFEDKDALGQINYNNLQYNGYNFIGSIPSHLIPPINIEAPNISIVDRTKCFFSREAYTRPSRRTIPTLNLSPLRYVPGFTIIGELVSAADLVQQMNNQASDFNNYFNTIRRIQQEEQFNSEIYIPKFDDFPTGRSDKALISISKDNIVWFKLEAGIFKYNNCPVLETKKYAYKKLHYFNELSSLARFDLKPINNLSNLLSVFKFKKIPIISGLNDQYKFDTNILFELIQESKNIVDLIKETISNLDNEIQTLKENEINLSNEEKEKLSKLEQLLNQYINLYDIVGPEGLQNDDIISIEQEEENKYILYYTINANYETGKKRIISFSDLLMYNKTLFSKHNLLLIADSLENFNLPSAVLKEEDFQKANGWLVSIDGLRAYSIYDTTNVEIYYLKEKLSDSENKRLTDLNNLLSTLNIQLNEEINKKPVELDVIETLKTEITKIKKDIFDIQYEKYINKIIAKGYIDNGQNYQTIFLLESPTPPNACLIIKPENNRIIVCDYLYKAFDNNEETSNPWTFTASLINSPVVLHPSDSIYHQGMYGTGSNSPIVSNLYSQEVVNYIKDFIEHIDIDKQYSNNHKEKILLLNETIKDENSLNQSVEFKTSLDRIFTYDINYGDSMQKYNSYYIMKDADKKDLLRAIDKIMNYDQYNAFFKNSKLSFMLEGSTEFDIYTLNDEGFIKFDKSISNKTIYRFKNINQETLQYDLLINRLETINKNIINKQNIINTKEKEKTTQLEQINNSISESKQHIAKLHLEYNRILFYLEKLDIDTKTKKSRYKDIMPHIWIEVIETDDSIEIVETPNSDQYFINIDAEQGCSLDLDKSPKILYQIVYDCLGFTAGNLTLTYVDAFKFCGSMFRGPQFTDNVNKLIIDNTYSVTMKNNRMEYTMLPNKVNEYIQKYTNNKLDWSDDRNFWTESRTFFLNGNGQIPGGIVRATYTYRVPSIKYDYDPEGVSWSRSLGHMGDYQKDKVKDLFNLDDTDTIYMDFKQIPRNLRNADSLFDKYIPNSNGMLTKALSLPGGGRMDNTLKMWRCYNMESGELIDIPDHFKWMNLMKYIAYYKNYLIDNQIFDINNNLQSIRVKDEIGLIPYDYK